MSDSLYTRDEAAAVEAQRLRFDWTKPSHTQSVTLGGRIYRIRATYKKRLGSWYLDLFLQDGTPVLTGKRITPGWSVNVGHHPDGEPAGFLIASNIADPYRKDNLGHELNVTFYPIANLKAVPPGEFVAVSVDLT